MLDFPRTIVVCYSPQPRHGFQKCVRVAPTVTVIIKFRVIALVIVFGIVTTVLIVIVFALPCLPQDAHTPAAMLNLKVKDMQKGTFVGKAAPRAHPKRV